MSNIDIGIEFPPELSVKIDSNSIKFVCKKSLGTNAVCKAKEGVRRAENRKLIGFKQTKSDCVITGGTIEDRIEFFIALLRDNKIFEAPERKIQYSFPIEVMEKIDSRIREGIDEKAIERIIPQYEFMIKLSKGELGEIKKEIDFSQNIVIPLEISSYLIYNFCADEDEIKMYKELFVHPSGFDEEEEEVEILPKSNTIHLSIPLKVPIRITYKFEEPTIELSFGKYGRLEVSDIKTIIESIIKRFGEYNRVSALYVHCDEVKTKKVNEYVSKFGCFSHCYLTLDTMFDDIVSTNVHILSSKEITPDVRQQITEVFKRLFEEHQLFFCSKCKCYYAPNEKECFTYYHEGKRIPIEGDEMEMVELNEDNEPIIYYNWTCCGEMPSDAPGCQKRPNGNHQKSPEIPKKSELIIQ